MTATNQGEARDMGVPDGLKGAAAGRPVGDRPVVVDSFDGPVVLAPPRVFPRHLAPATRRQIAGRASQIARVTAKNFVPLAARAAAKREIEADAYARPLRRTFEELGATFMKFGQLIGSSPGVFGDVAAAEFRSCLDTGPVVPFDIIRLVVERDLGMPLEQAFTSFDPEPIGRASIAVVHRATLPNGDDVAVKVLRPGISSRVATDLDLFEPMLITIARLTGEQAAGQLLQMFEGFRAQMGEELDLRNEMRAMSHYRQLLEVVDLPLVTVPAPYPEFSSANVLTMEFVEGVPVDDLATLAKYGYDPAPVVQETVRGLLLTTLRWGTFHGDVHAGNLLLRPDGKVAIIDWGIVGRLDPGTHQFFRRLVEAALGDESAWPAIAAHTKDVYGPALEHMGMDDEYLTEFMRATLEPLLTLPFGQVSLAELLLAPQREVAKSRGIEANERTVRAVFKRFSEQRKVRALAEAHGAYDSEFDRGIFLLSKQLMYFERYGKMFLRDVSLFEDQDFFRKVLALPVQNLSGHPGPPVGP